MAKPMGKRRTKRTYLGSGAGSLRSGTGTTAKKPIQRGRSPLRTKRNQKLLDDLTNKLRKRNLKELRTTTPFPIPKTRPRRPITPQSPATGLGSVFEKQAKRQRRKTATTLRRRAKR